MMNTGKGKVRLLERSLEAKGLKVIYLTERRMRFPVLSGSQELSLPQNFHPDTYRVVHV